MNSVSLKVTSNLFIAREISWVKQFLHLYINLTHMNVYQSCVYITDITSFHSYHRKITHVTVHLRDIKASEPIVGCNIYYYGVTYFIPSCNRVGPHGVHNVMQWVPHGVYHGHCSNMQMSTSPMTQFWSTDSAPVQTAFTPEQYANA